MTNNQGITTNNTLMPTIAKRLQQFYDQLREQEGIHFRFAKNKVREIGNKCKLIYDKGHKRNPQKYPIVDYVTTDEWNKKIRVRKYPEDFYPVIDIVIRQTFEKFKANVEAEAKRGNLQPKQKVLGRLSRPLRPRNLPVHRQKRKDDENQ